MLQPTKLEAVRDVKIALILDTWIQNLEFALLVFSLALVQYFLTMLLLGMVMYILNHYMMELCDLLFYFDFTGVSVKRLPQVQKRLWALKQC